MRKLRGRKGRKELEGFVQAAVKATNCVTHKTWFLYVPSTCEPDLPDEYSSEKRGRKKEEKKRMRQVRSK